MNKTLKVITITSPVIIATFIAYNIFATNTPKVSTVKTVAPVAKHVEIEKSNPVAEVKSEEKVEAQSSPVTTVKPTEVQAPVEPTHIKTNEEVGIEYLMTNQSTPFKRCFNEIVSEMPDLFTDANREKSAIALKYWGVTMLCTKDMSPLGQAQHLSDARSIIEARS